MLQKDATTLPKLIPIAVDENAIVAPIGEQNNEKVKKVLTLKKADPEASKNNELAPKEPEMVPKLKTGEIKSAEISITFTKKRIFVQLPKNDTDTQFLGSFRFVHWNTNNRQWIIPNYGKNLELIKNYFQNRRVEITKQHEENPVGF